MLNLYDFLQLGTPPPSIILGTYRSGLLILSFVIIFFASYVAMDFVSRLSTETNKKIKKYWIIGGAFSMGAGMWAMHFMDMLAFKLPMPITYNTYFTLASLILAIGSTGLAFYLIRNAPFKLPSLAASGIVMGLGIAAMHYIGMAGMVGVQIRYLPGLFIGSFVIAILASITALWFALKSSQGSYKQQIPIKLLSAFIMGGAVSGLHHMGVATAIITHSPTIETVNSIKPFFLSLYIAAATGGILCMALIVSIYKQLIEDTVQNEKYFLNAVLNNLSDGVLACDKHGKITVANPAFKSLINLGENDELSGELDRYFLLYQLNSKEPISRLDLPLIRALRGEKINDLELELKLKLTDKENLKRQIIISGQPIFNTRAETLGAVIAIHDVTENNKARDLVDLNRELEEFATITSHDLKAPLRAIERLTSWIEEDSYAGLNDESKKHFNLLKKRVARMNTLIEGILHYSRVGRKNIPSSKVDVKLLLDDIILGLWIPSRFDIQIISDMPTLNTPEILLRQVFSNLINNAMKHHNGVSGKILISSTKVGDSFQFCVQDDGPGIPKVFQERIFDIYQTLNSDSEKENSGIGLAIVKKAISRVNGKIWVESEEGKGASFYFTWPAMEYQDSKAS